MTSEDLNIHFYSYFDTINALDQNDYTILIKQLYTSEMYVQNIYYDLYYHIVFQYNYIYEYVFVVMKMDRFTLNVCPLPIQFSNYIIIIAQMTLSGLRSRLVYETKDQVIMMLK